MCYHVSSQVQMERLLEYFPDLVMDNYSEPENQPTAYLNGFDHPMVKTILTGRKDHRRHLAAMLWGFFACHAAASIISAKCKGRK